ncbi:hypothetical protein [[Phormidium] sp. LEGE 05292]|uniref:hypothetical protein n=1 Tax=[Phormidium] sp. LEGE 05292 TaxID=767427 RepID=UPI001D1598B2|nr:hypothetical protein [Phormidium sp. LEGE 05292]
MIVLAAQGIPQLPDLTQPSQIMQFGSEILRLFLILIGLVGVLGMAIALLSFSLFSLRKDAPEPGIFIGEWVVRYSALLRGLQHTALVLIILIVGFFLCTTLANRYHFWEQARVTQVAESVAGDRLEQTAPQVRYTIQEPLSYNRQVGNRIVKVEEKRTVNRLLAINGSQVQVSIMQASDPQKNDRNIYLVDFAAEYQVINRLKDTDNFILEVPPPNGYSLLQNFKVEQNGTRLEPTNPGEYTFPVRLPSNTETRFRVTYQAQGASRWVYNANGQLLSNFRLSVLANFPNADFASGVVPTEAKPEGKGTRFTWIFDDNVSVLNPFGVFTATGTIRNTGILPRLLLLAPAIFLWWLLLLYFSIPMKLKDVAITGGIFFATILALTYLSRIINPQLAWTIVSLILLTLAWGLGRNLRTSLAAFICTIAGAVIPILGLLVPYSGLTLSIAGLLSAIWLAVLNWYGWYPRQQ